MNANACDCRWTCGLRMRRPNGAGIDRQDDCVNMIRYDRKCMRLQMDMRVMHVVAAHASSLRGRTRQHHDFMNAIRHCRNGVRCRVAPRPWQRIRLSWIAMPMSRAGCNQRRKISAERWAMDTSGPQYKPKRMLGMMKSTVITTVKGPSCSFGAVPTGASRKYIFLITRA
jgi:hypothetical protein